MLPVGTFSAELFVFCSGDGDRVAFCNWSEADAVDKGFEVGLSGVVEDVAFAQLGCKSLPEGAEDAGNGAEFGSD